MLMRLLLYGGTCAGFFHSPRPNILDWLWFGSVFVSHNDHLFASINVCSPCVAPNPGSSVCVCVCLTERLTEVSECCDKIIELIASILRTHHIHMYIGYCLSFPLVVVVFVCVRFSLPFVWIVNTICTLRAQSAWIALASPLPQYFYFFLHSFFFVFYKSQQFICKWL